MPTAANDSYSNLVDGRIEAAAPGVLGNDSDPEGAPLTAMIQTMPAGGSLDFRGDGSFVYFPYPGFVGTDSFTYSVYDGSQFSATATVTLHVNLAVSPGGRGGTCT